MKQSTTRPFADLATWRASRRWTQQQAADYLGISHKSYQRFERGERALSGPKAKRVMEKTGVPIEVLVGAA